MESRRKKYLWEIASSLGKDRNSFYSSAALFPIFMEEIEETSDPERLWELRKLAPAGSEPDKESDRKIAMICRAELRQNTDVKYVRGWLKYAQKGSELESEILDKLGELYREEINRGVDIERKMYLYNLAPEGSAPKKMVYYEIDQYYRAEILQTMEIEKLDQIVDIVPEGTELKKFAIAKRDYKRDKPVLEKIRRAKTVDEARENLKSVKGTKMEPVAIDMFDELFIKVIEAATTPEQAFENLRSLPDGSKLCQPALDKLDDVCLKTAMDEEDPEKLRILYSHCTPAIGKSRRFIEEKIDIFNLALIEHTNDVRKLKEMDRTMLSGSKSEKELTIKLVKRLLEEIEASKKPDEVKEYFKMAPKEEVRTAAVFKLHDITYYKYIT